MSKKSVGIFVGSLRRDSFSRMVARILSDILKDRFDTKFLEISSLVMYNQDLENDANLPEGWRCFRQEVLAVDAVLFVTPEYNRSVPAVLKNALDVASRPMAANAWSGKPGAIVSISPGKIGGFGVNQHLRQTAACLNIYMMPQPEAYIGDIASLADTHGADSIREFLRVFADAYANWVDRLTTQPRETQII